MLNKIGDKATPYLRPQKKLKPGYNVVPTFSLLFDPYTYACLKSMNTWCNTLSNSINYLSVNS